MAKKTPEVKVKDKIKAIIKACNGYYCLPVMSGMNENGTPDFLVCIGGIFIAVEAKAGNNTPTTLQKVRLREIRSKGGIAVVVNERGLADFAQLCNFCMNCGDAEVLNRMREYVPVNLTEPFSE